ncbi:diguanylate cyclase domain-containing protein [Modestobacter marinus]|uniref:diguanylate cyclase domain-containing protein n=1 Tax=Modestobacter marinus TaxID=477641 RepID=UPI001C94C85C|nr:diguanylate cyclase [Modestobacter marinus]
MNGPVRHAVLATLAGLLALAVGASAPADAPWGNLVLTAVSGWTAWRVHRLTRRLDGGHRPWQVLSVASLLFALTNLLSATGLDGEDGGPATGDLVLVLATLGLSLSCVLLAGHGTGGRWHVLALDGATVVAALIVMADVLLISPAFRADPVDSTLLLAYGAYPAFSVGLAAALCTVSATALRRSATALAVMITLLGLASALFSVSVVQSARTWELAADVAVLLAMVSGVLAVELVPPGRDGDPAASRPTVNPVGLVLQVGALVGVPATLLAAVVFDLPVGPVTIIGTAVLLSLLVVRLFDRIRDSGRIRDDLLRSEEDFRGLVEASTDGVAIVDADLRLEFTSPAARTLLGIDPDGDRHPGLLDLLPTEDRARVLRELTAAGGEANPVVSLRVPRAPGEFRDLEVTHHERPGSDRRVLQLRDVSTRRRRERELERMAFTDHLTRLPNRAMLFRELATLSAASDERSLLVLDLDGFKAVNDTAGHEAGDLLLIEVARRLQGLLRSEDLVARLGGDEFAVLVVGDEEAAVEAARRIVEVLAQPCRVGDRTFIVGASVGVARVHPGGGQLAFREADTALRTAKEAGKGCWRVHTADLVGQAAASRDVASALAEGEVQLRFDAIAHGDTGVISAVRAQPVWVHPGLGVLPAPELWAAAERQGQTAALQQWVVRTACREAVALDRELLVTVDLPAGLVHADELPGEVAAALALSGLAPSRLVLSFTEEVLQTSSAALIPALLTLHEAEVRLALDDYGMGSTLWALLARVPLDVVMVDMRALDVPRHPGRSLQVLTAIARSAHGFGLDTVATEVDSPEMLADVRAGGLVSVTGAVLPTALTAAQLAVLLRHPSSAVALPASRSHAEV